MIKVLIVDDHRIFVDALCAMFAEDRDIEVVGTATDSAQALSKLEKGGVDIALMDIRMPKSEMDGMELAEYIYEHFPQVRVILLSSHQEGKIISRAINSSISGYMIKNAAGMELKKAINDVSQGDTFYSVEIMKSHMDYMRKQGSENEGVKLTRREKEVLQFIVEEFNTMEIGQKLGIGEAGIETHRRNIRHKLGVRNTAGMVREAVIRNLVDLSKYN